MSSLVGRVRLKHMSRFRARVRGVAHRVLWFACVAFLPGAFVGCGGVPVAASEARYAQADMGAAAHPEMAEETAAPAPQGAPMPGSAVFAKGDAPPPGPRQLEATSGTLLVYTAELHVAVYEAEQALDRAVAIAKQLGGHVTLRTNDRVILRVPRERFDDALLQLDGIGDILHREIRAEDVGEAFRDLHVRLKNARAVRDRLAELLARAQNVADALKVEQELSRITLEIERLEAMIRGLGDRIAFSTITLVFRPRPTERVRDDVRELPFPFLSELGLPNLLNLQETR